MRSKYQKRRRKKKRKRKRRKVITSGYAGVIDIFEVWQLVHPTKPLKGYSFHFFVIHLNQVRKLEFSAQ